MIPTTLRNIIFSAGLTLSIGCNTDNNCPTMNCPDYTIITECNHDTEDAGVYDTANDSETVDSDTFDSETVDSSTVDSDTVENNDPNQDLVSLFESIMEENEEGKYTEYEPLADECEVPYYKQVELRDDVLESEKAWGAVDCTGQKDCIMNQQLIDDVKTSVPNLPLDIRVYDEWGHSGFNASCYPAYTLIMNKDLLTIAHYTALGFFAEMCDSEDEFVFKDYVNNLLLEIDTGAELSLPPENDCGTNIEHTLMADSFIGGILAHEAGHAYHQHYERTRCAELKGFADDNLYDTIMDQINQRKLSRFHEHQADIFAAEFLMHSFTDEGEGTYTYIPEKDMYQKYSPAGLLLSMHVIRLLNEDWVPSPLDTHPPAEDRIEVIKMAIEDNGWVNEKYMAVLDELEGYVYTK